MDIYDFFNSRDIAVHCRSIDHKFTAIETAYLVWHSNHHTLKEKHNAWMEIINSMPDENFHHNWDLDDHTLHSFLNTYMRLQNEFIDDFCTTREGYIYTYATLNTSSDQYYPDDILFNSYEACLDALKSNELDDDPYNEIAKAKIIRRRLYSSPVSFRNAEEPESIVFDKQLHPVDIEPACESEGEQRFLEPSYGFYEMWVAIPTPFKRGDIVTDVDLYDNHTKKHKPLLLESLPYWKRGAENGDGCEERIEQLLSLGVDWTDMQAGFYFQDNNGEIYWDHAFDYLDLEYYHDELQGTEKLLLAVSNSILGKITAEELLRSHSIILMENYVEEQHRYFGGNTELLQLCGLKQDKCE